MNRELSIVSSDEAVWASLQARISEGDVEEFWSTQPWNDLKYSECRLFGILGCDEENWEGSTEQPESKTATWDELTTEEQDAATQLGYDQETWDAPEAK